MEAKALQNFGEPVQFIRSAAGVEMIQGYAIRYFDGSAETEAPTGKVPLRERVKPGVFNNYVRSGKRIPILFQHDETLEIGATDQNDTQISCDNKGVFVAIVYDETDPTHQLIKAKSRKVKSLGWSFNADGFDRTGKDANGYFKEIYDIHKVRDISIVYRPAYVGTGGKVFVRSEEEAQKEIAAYERTIKIKAEAKTLLARINKTTQ